jgi:hypothetical protein
MYVARWNVLTAGERETSKGSDLYIGYDVGGLHLWTILSVRGR